ncbi:MAG TPA: hypothetical protein VGK59_14170 [Ohtaekwangia sp.]
MKTTIFLRGLFVVAFLIVSMGVMAQGRGRSNGRDRGHTNGYQRDYHHNDRHDRHDHHRSHQDVYVHHHHHAPVYRRVTYHYHYRPVRYVYYRDYDVYYDCDRSVYISYSGRGWTISTGMPVILHHVDMQRAARVDVDDYYDDDFVGHLDRNRPNGKLYAEW